MPILTLNHLKCYALKMKFAVNKRANSKHLYGQTLLSMDTSLIWTPHYYGQFALSLGKEILYIFSKLNLLNTDTLLIGHFLWHPQGPY